MKSLHPSKGLWRTAMLVYLEHMDNSETATSPKTQPQRE